MCICTGVVELQRLRIVLGKGANAHLFARFFPSQEVTRNVVEAE